MHEVVEKIIERCLSKGYNNTFIVRSKHAPVHLLSQYKGTLKPLHHIAGSMLIQFVKLVQLLSLY